MSNEMNSVDHWGVTTFLRQIQHDIGTKIVKNVPFCCLAIFFVIGVIINAPPQAGACTKSIIGATKDFVDSGCSCGMESFLEFTGDYLKDCTKTSDTKEICGETCVKYTDILGI